MSSNPSPSGNCKYFAASVCSSCTFMELNEADCASKKLSKLKSRINELLPHQPTDLVRDLVSPKTSLPSRAKAKFSIAGTINNPKIGILDEALAGVDLRDCPLHFVPIQEVANSLPKYISEFKLPPYDAVKRCGDLKAVIISYSTKYDELMVRFVVRSAEAKSIVRDIVKRILVELPKVRVATINVQPLPAAILEGEQEEVLTNEFFLKEKYSRYEVWFTPQSFMQVTPEVAKALYDTAANIAKLAGASRILDLFCGSGGFSFACANSKNKVLGIETTKMAISCASEAAKAQGISNADFVYGDADAWALGFQDFNPDLIIANPPRRGLSKELCAALDSSDSRTILYSSCNPETLLRDLNSLKQYQVKAFYPFDMFPLTEHLEVLAHLERQV